MGVVQSCLKGRTPQENLVFCRKFIKYKKKNTQESKRELCKVKWKGGYLKKKLVFCWKSVNIRRRILKRVELGVVRSDLKWRIPQENFVIRRKSVPLGILFDPQRREIEKREFDKKYQEKSCEIPTTFGLEGSRGRKKMWEEERLTSVDESPDLSTIRQKQQKQESI